MTRDLRGLRLLRDAAAGRLLRADARPPAGAGRTRDRLRRAVALATLASRSAVLAAAVTAVVAFAVLFSGVVSSVLAGATTSLLLAFVLPVSLPGPLASIPDRLAGWGLAGAASLVAISLLWPAPARNRLRAPRRRRLPGACRAPARRDRRTSPAGSAGLEARSCRRGDEPTRPWRHCTTFFATPYRPTGLSTAARALVRLVDELRWLNSDRAAVEPRGAAGRPACRARQAAPPPTCSPPAAAARPPPAPATGWATRARAAAGGAARDGAQRSAAAVACPGRCHADDRQPRSPGRRLRARSRFRAQELSFVVGQIAANRPRRGRRAAQLARAPAGSPAGTSRPLASARERAGAHSSAIRRGCTTA